MASDSSCVFSHFWLGVLHISLHIHKAQPRGWEKKDKRTNTGLGQLQAQVREFVTLCILRAFVDHRRRVFCVKLLQKPQGMLTHLWLSFLTVSFCWPSFPWMRYLAPTGLFCPPLSTGSLCLLWDLPSHFRSRGIFRPQSFVWISRKNRQRDRPSGTSTNGNELLRIVSLKYIFDMFSLTCTCPSTRRTLNLIIKSLW